eukprot:360488-Chlamydomonas_euryale.AAC.21
MGYAAAQGTCDWPIVLPLYAGAACWTIVYDTIYAHQVRRNRACDARLHKRTAPSGMFRFRVRVTGSEPARNMPVLSAARDEGMKHLLAGPSYCAWNETPSGRTLILCME